MRINKYLATCGFGSRRSCEELVKQGLVLVNGKPVTDLGFRVSEEDKITVSGKTAALATRTRTILLNKPRDVLCTASDPQGRKTVFSIIPAFEERLFTVGRLDRASEGLLLLTNDGELANRITHPRYHIKKVYRVRTHAPLNTNQIEAMRSGIQSDGDLLQVVDIEIEDHAQYKIELAEGKNRHIRRMFEELGYDVTSLRRIELGPLHIRALGRGEWMELEGKNLDRLYQAVKLKAPKATTSSTTTTSSGTQADSKQNAHEASGGKGGSGGSGGSSAQSQERGKPASGRKGAQSRSSSQTRSSSQSRSSSQGRSSESKGSGGYGGGSGGRSGGYGRGGNRKGGPGGFQGGKSNRGRGPGGGRSR